MTVKERYKRNLANGHSRFISITNALPVECFTILPIFIGLVIGLLI